MSEEASEGLAARLPEMKWGTVRTPGCYLVTETGRLVRMTLDAIYDPDVLLSLAPSTWMARLSENPQDPTVVLRRHAAAHGYFVNF